MQEFNPLYLHPYKYNQWSKVPRGPVAAAVGSFLFGATATAFTVAGAAVTWGTIGGFLITTAVASWAISALTPKPQGVSGREGLLTNRREPVGNFDIVYGKVRKGGIITFMEATGDKNKYLHFIVTLAGHEVEAIEDVYINENIVSLDANGFVNADPWDGKVRIKKMLGAPNQVAQPQLVAETSVNSNFRGRGIAYLYVRLEYDNEVFAEGIPNFTAVVKGKKVFDPRTNETVWSDNAALCIRDYLRDPLGVNSAQSPESLQSDSWAVGANVCDSVITKKNSSTEKRYTLNGVVSTANTPRENLQQMLTSCGGTLFWGQGQWQFKAGYFPSGPYVNLGMGDLRSGISLVTKNSRKENFNSVSGVFVNANKDWVETEYPRVSSSVFLAQDNGQENSLDMELPYTTSPSAAQRLAKMAMFRSREEIVISANFSLKASKVKVGDVVRFSFERYGFTNKYFEVLSWKLVSESDGLVINMTMKETSADAYAWNAEEKDILGNNTTLPQPRAGLSVSGLNVTNRQTLQSDGTFLGEVLLSWNPAENAFVYRYDVQWRKNAESAWSSTQTTESEVIIPSIKSGVSYIYRVRAVSVGGFVGAWEQIGATVSGKDTPPGLPTNVQTKDLYRAVQVTWNNPTDRDLNHIEIYTNTSNTTTGATKVGESGGTKFIYDMEPMESRWFFLKAVDHSGNKSGFTAGKKGTALFIEQSDVDIDVDQLLEDAGLNAVEVLPNLPTTDNYDGRTVYNTDDRQLYIYDGSTNEWKPAVESFNPDDLILERDNFPADLKPVEVLSSLPTTGNFEGRVVMLLSDGKLYRYKNGEFTAAVPTGDLVGQIGSSQIVNGAISAIKLASNAVTAVKISNGAVEESKIATGAVTGNKISDNAVTETKILDGSISTPKITTNAITSDKIVANAVTTAKIDALAITAGKIAVGAITASKIQAGAVGADQIAANSIVSSKLVLGDLSNAVPDNMFYDLGNGSWEVTNSDMQLNVYSGNPAYQSSSRILACDITETTGGSNGFLGMIQTTKNIPVESDRDYYFAVNVRSFNSNTYGQARLALEIQDAGGNTIDQPWLSGPFDMGGASGAQGTVITAQHKMPANAAHIIFRVRVSRDSAGVVGGRLEIWNPTVRRASSGELIVDGAITTDKLSANAVTANKIQAGAITSDKIEANAITAGKIAAGAVAADKIAVGAISARHVLIGDVTNLFDDQNFEAVNTDVYSKWDGGNFDVDTYTSTWSGYENDKILRIRSGAVISNGSGVRYAYKDDGILVTPGRTYKFSCLIGRAGNDTTSNNTRGIMRVYLYKRGLDGSTSYSRSISIGFNSEGTQRYEGEFTVGFDENCIVITFQVIADNYPTVSDQHIVFNNPRITAMQSGELIVDGAITADKIASNSVNTGHLVANSVTAGIIAAGAVDASAIKSNAVTADKINVNNLSAISANLGSITGGSININGKFIVNSNGTTTIRSGTSGERLVIEENRISVFDNSGTLRVRLGQL